MKNRFLLIALALSTSLLAQTKAKEQKPPAIVKEAFEKEYPSKKAKWGAEGNDFEAEFKINGVDASAIYDKTGHRKAYEIEIKKEQLPEMALTYLKKNYQGNRITETAKITDDKDVVTYEAEIKKKGKSFDVIFDAKGNFIKIESAD